jgi:hypothetical protein
MQLVLADNVKNRQLMKLDKEMNSDSSDIDNDPLSKLSSE